MSIDRRPTLSPDEIMNALPERLRLQIEREEQREQIDREARRVDLARELRSVREAGAREAAKLSIDWDRAIAEERKGETALAAMRDATHRAKAAKFNHSLAYEYSVNKLTGQIRDLADPKWQAARERLEATEAQLREVHPEAHAEHKEVESTRPGSLGVVRKLIRLFSNRRSVAQCYAAIHEGYHAIDRGMSTAGIDVDAEIERILASIPAIGSPEMVFEDEEAKKERLKAEAERRQKLGVA
jgi:hypothetical protein